MAWSNTEEDSSSWWRTLLHGPSWAFFWFQKVLGGCKSSPPSAAAVERWQGGTSSASHCVSCSHLVSEINYSFINSLDYLIVQEGAVSKQPGWCSYLQCQWHLLHEWWRSTRQDQSVLTSLQAVYDCCLPCSPGHHNQLTTLKSGEDAIQRNEKALTVIYSEESIAKRKERNKTMGAIKQTETIYMLMSPGGCRVMKKQRFLELMIIWW